MKRNVLFILVCVMLLALVSCGPAPSVSPETDKEIEQAIAYGIVPEEIQGDYDEPITFRQYTEMLTRLITLWNDEKLAEWETLVQTAAMSEEEMCREDGILEMSYAMVMMGHIEPNGFVDDNLDTVQDAMADCVLSWDYKMFPSWQEEAYPLLQSDYMWGGVMMCSVHRSLVSGNVIYPFEPNGNAKYLTESLSRADAIRAVLRFGETDPTVFEQDGMYVNLNEVGRYDKKIITDELLNAPTDLPEVTQSKLPSEWKGAGLAVGKDIRTSLLDYRKYHESDIIFLAENGFNFTRVFFSFSTLRFPDFPEDIRQVNENELRELDELIAWGIKYGVHIQLSASFYLDEAGNNKTDGSMPTTEDEWAIYRDYWTMLTHRYAGISSRYLSFDLNNEAEPAEGGDLSFAKRNIENVISSMRDADSERVLLYSYSGNPNMEWVKTAAQLGIAIGCHPYYPSYMTTSGWDYMEQNPYATPAWPQLWLPSMKVRCGQVPLVFQGNLGGCTVSVHVSRVDEGGGGLAAYGDGSQIAAVFITNPQPEDLFTFNVPDGTQKVELWVTDAGAHFADIDTIIIETSSRKTVLVPHDICDNPDWSDPLPVIVNEDGTCTNEENYWIDAEELYNCRIAPMKAIADSYGVGFMVNEFGIFSVDVDWDIDVVAQYHDDILAMLEAHDLPWNYCELYNQIPNHIINMYGKPSQWKGATMVEQQYGGERYFVCQELLDIFRKYISSDK